ncbi:glucosaminidase domain-containing protein [Candidatus Daviesbacteria bacterium]|nr:glucosaminidase domain-containing protein [Candidatus Daviesbacteria bacterium]
MKKKITIFLLVILLLNFPSFSLTEKTQAEELVVENSQFNLVEAKKLDRRAEILSSYLAKFDSPLQYHAQDFIDAAETYQLDWKMLPAIAGVESTFGKQIPGGYNGWGWGVYGTQAIYFTSWRDAIFTISKGLREGYLDKGLNDPYSMNRVYAASPHWGGKVSYFMQDLENFADKFELNKQQTTSVGKAPSIAAISGQPRLDRGQLALR